MKKVIEFIKEEKIIFLLTFILMFILYFFYFNNIISVDTELFITEKKMMLDSWIAINRFSLVFFKNIFDVPFNILTTRIFTIILFYISIILFTYLFTKWINKKNHIIVFISVLFLLTTPIFAEQFSFTLQSVEIAFGLLLFAINFILIDKYLEESKKIYIIPSIVITVFCFGLYQAFVIMYVAFSAFYIITHEHNKIKELIFIFFITFIIYYLISFFIKNYVYDVSSQYLSNNFKWKEYGIIRSILRIGYFGLTTLLGITKFHSIVYLLFTIIGFILTIKNKKIKDAIFYFGLVLIPFSLIIITGTNTAYRAQFSYIFVLLFMFLYLIKITNKKVLNIIYVLSFICIAKQLIITPTLLYNDYKRFNKDVEFANYISETVDYKEHCLIFVGSYNSGIKIKGETLAHPYTEWDSETEFGVNGRLYHFFKIRNIDYRMPTIEEYQTAKKFISDNPTDEVFIYQDDYIIINLDNMK